MSDDGDDDFASDFLLIFKNSSDYEKKEFINDNRWALSRVLNYSSYLAAYPSHGKF